MDAYVFGSHGGDLPTHLVGNGPAGNRIRAAARLQGDHDAFYALEAETDADVDRHVDALTRAGTTPAVVLRPHGEWGSLGPIVLPPLPPPPTPAWIPPCPWLVFVLCELDDAAAAVGGLVEDLGEDRVAVWRADDGRYLIEAGADDRDRLETALSRVADSAGLVSSVRLFTTGDELTRA